MGYLLDKLEEKNLSSEVNLVLTSDHGMTEIDFQEKRIEIASLVNLSDIVRKSDKGPLMHITPVEGKLESVYQALSKSDKMTVYKKEDIPEFWHYKNNRRVMPILCVADEGWSVLWVSKYLWLFGVKYILLVPPIQFRRLGFRTLLKKGI